MNIKKTIFQIIISFCFILVLVMNTHNTKAEILPLTLMEISRPDDILQDITTAENGLFFNDSLVNGNEYLYSFTLNERTWVSFAEYHGYYCGWGSTLSLYGNASLTAIVPKIVHGYGYSVKLMDNMYRCDYYLNPGTYYVKLRYLNDAFRNPLVVYGYAIPSSKILSYSVVSETFDSKTIRIKINPSGTGAKTMMMSDISSVNNVTDRSYWNENAEKITVNADDTYTINENGNYSVRVSFNTNEWLDFCFDITFSITDLGKEIPISKPVIKSIENTSSGISISWNKCSGADEYAIYRVYNGKSKKIKTVKSSVNSYVDKAVEEANGKQFSYYVKACNRTTTVKSAQKTIIRLVTPVISKLSCDKKGQIKATWKKSSAGQGYQIRYSLKSNFSSSKTVSVNSLKTLSTVIKNLKSKKTYYVSVRTYTKLSGKTIYSDWSKSKKIVTK